MKKWKPSIKLRAEMLWDHFDGHGLDALVEHHGERYGVSRSTIYRRMEEDIRIVYSAVSETLRRSRLGDMKLEFGKIWEMDAKTIPVIDKNWQAAGHFLHSYKPKGGRRVGQTQWCSITDISGTKFLLVTENVGKGSTEEYARVLELAILRAGSYPALLRFDGLDSQSAACEQYFKDKFPYLVLEKIGEYSWVHNVEGFHHTMDRTLESGLHGGSYSEILGVWLHKNFVEPKDDLKMTSFEKARGGQRTCQANRWEFLLEFALSHHIREKFSYEGNPHPKVKWHQGSLWTKE